MRTSITGASSGLGAGMVRELAARGHDLALAARRLDRLEALRDELGGLDRVVVNVAPRTDLDEGMTVPFASTRSPAPARWPTPSSAPRVRLRPDLAVEPARPGPAHGADADSPSRHLTTVEVCPT